MPYKSLAQARYFNANRKKLEAEGVDVEEWNASSKGKKLPKKADAHADFLAAAKEKREAVEKAEKTAGNNWRKTSYDDKLKRLYERKGLNPDGSSKFTKTAADLPGWVLPAGGAVAGGLLARHFQDPADDSLGAPLLGAAAGLGAGILGNMGIDAYQSGAARRALESLTQRAGQAGATPHKSGQGFMVDGRYVPNEQMEGALKGAPLDLAPDQEGMYRVAPGIRWAPSSAGPRATPGAARDQSFENGRQAAGLGMPDVAQGQNGLGQAAQARILADQDAFMQRENAFSAQHPGYTPHAATSDVAAHK